MYNFLIGLVLTLTAFVYILIFVKDSQEMKEIQAAEEAEAAAAKEDNNNPPKEKVDEEKVKEFNEEEKPREAEGIKGILYETRFDKAHA